MSEGAIKTIDDVAKQCKLYGWKRLIGEDVHPYAWRSPDEEYACCISALGSTMTGIHISIPGSREARENGVPDVQLAKVEPYTEESGSLLNVLLKGLDCLKVWEENNDQ